MATNLRPVRPIAPARYLLQTAPILSALAISSALLAYSLAHQMVPGSLHRIPPRLLPVAITISLTITVIVLFQFQHERNFWGNAWGCIRAGAPIGALAAIPFWIVLRRGAILSPGITGAATGLFAGLVGTSVLEIHCPNLNGWHILLSHLGVAILCALAGLFIGWAAEVKGVNHAGEAGQPPR